MNKIQKKQNKYQADAREGTPRCNGEKQENVLKNYDNYRQFGTIAKTMNEKQTTFI